MSKIIFLLQNYHFWILRSKIFRNHAECCYTCDSMVENEKKSSITELWSKGNFVTFWSDRCKLVFVFHDLINTLVSNRQALDRNVFKTFRNSTRNHENDQIVTTIKICQTYILLQEIWQFNMLFFIIIDISTYKKQKKLENSKMINL